MRKSLVELIETCYRVKTYAFSSSYELHHYEDGSFADICTDKILEPKALCTLIGKLNFKIIPDEGKVRIRIFEDFNEYDY